MPLTVVNGISVFGTQVLAAVNVGDPNYWAIWMPTAIDPNGPRWGFARLLSYTQDGSRFWTWQSQAITGYGCVFSQVGRPPTSNPKMALVADWKRAGIPYTIEYLS